MKNPKGKKIWRKYNHDLEDVDLQEWYNFEEEQIFGLVVLLVNCLLNCWILKVRLVVSSISFSIEIFANICYFLLIFWIFIYAIKCF